jgi:hypothetical protein
MPRTKYTQPPGVFPPLSQIQQVCFRFEPHERKALRDLLPKRLRELGVPDDCQNQAAQARHRPVCRLATLADVVVYEAEAVIASHLSGVKLFSKDKGTRLPTPATVRAAIRRLRTALEPFERGWVDEETASLLPPGLGEILAARERELESIKVGGMNRRILYTTCARIGIIVRHFVSANRARIRKRNLRQFVAQALDFAGIGYPDPESHPERLDKLIFPPPAVRHRQSAG